MTRETALALIATTKFAPFTKADFMAFGGVETENPLIGESDEWLIIIDGNLVDFLPIDPIDGKDNPFTLSLNWA